jgi:hypothetical protein
MTIRVKSIDFPSKTGSQFNETMDELLLQTGIERNQIVSINIRNDQCLIFFEDI